MGKKSKEYKYSMCEVTQSVEHLSEEQIRKALNRTCIEKYAYICHDKDVETEGENAGKLKQAHWHIMLKFRKNDSRSLKNVAGWFDIKPQYVEKSRFGRYDRMLLYLIHYGYTDKYQYEISEVKANFDYKAFVDNQNSRKKLAEIINLIETEVIKRHNYPNYISCTDYTKYKSQIENAFKYVDDKKQSANHHKDVIYISGTSSSGKTYFAKKYAADRNMSIYFNDAGKDAAGGYRDEDVFVLDDLRLGDMSYNELLKMLDNDTCTKVASRYYNKSIAACKVIIITSVFSPMQMFGRYCRENNDDIYQIKRRCKVWLDMDRDTIRFYEVDEDKQDYVLTEECENPLKDADFKKNTTNSFIDDLKGSLTVKTPPVQPAPEQAEGMANSNGKTEDIFIPF